MTVSVALIVKNEERTLDRCLGSLQGAVDEIVVVDTGSEDATRDVARRYTDRVFDFPWCQDFAAARQFAFDHATSDWVAWVDADDVVLGADQIRTLAQDAPAHVGGFYWRYVVDRDTWGNVRCEYWRERCVRNDGTFRWVGRVHEVLVPLQPCELARSDAVVVEHRRAAGRDVQQSRRNLDILEQEYAATDDATPRLLFYLGREYAEAGDTDKALAFYSQYLQVATWDEERYLAHRQVADLHRAERRYEQAIDAEWQALKVCPHWPDAYFGLARTYYFRREWHKVVHWAEVGRAMPPPQTVHIHNPMDYRYNWIIYYTNALYHIGAAQEAQAWTRRALEICPDDAHHRENFLFFGGR